MVLYRKIHPLQLLLLKAGFVLMLIAVVILFKSGLLNGFYFCIVLMTFLAFVHPKDFLISDNSIEVISYFFFSFFPVRKKYLKTDNTVIRGQGAYFGQEGEATQMDDTGTGFGCLFSVFSIFFPPVIIKRTYSFSKTVNDRIYLSHIDLNQREFAMLEQWIITSAAFYAIDYAAFFKTFRTHIFRMSFERQLDFGILISRKLYPDYQKFSDHEQWGNPDILAKAIALCEKRRDIKIELFEFELMIQKIDEITPDMDDFGNADGSCALNACVAIHATLRLLATEGRYSVEGAGLAYYDTQDARLWDSALTDAERDEHELMSEAKKFLLRETRK